MASLAVSDEVASRNILSLGGGGDCGSLDEDEPLDIVVLLDVELEVGVSGGDGLTPLEIVFGASVPTPVVIVFGASVPTPVVIVFGASVPTPVVIVFTGGDGACCITWSVFCSSCGAL